jgi:integrase/recombinase XerD
VTTTRLPKPYEPAELDALRRAAHDRPDVGAAMVFLHETGLRIAEACAITSTEAGAWPRPPWWCRRPTCRTHRRTVRIIGKGDRERVVVLTPAALRSAATLLTFSTNGHLFPWTDRGVRYLFERVGAAAGVHCHPHRFRHTHATELVEAGVAIEVVADMLGHSTTEITRLYWMASERAKVAALSRRRRWRARSR